MRVTLAAIAARTNCSIAAVSEVLNNHPHARTFRAETRNRILETARSMGYRRDENAAITRTGVSKTIAVLFDFENLNASSADWTILSGVLTEASKSGFNIKIHETGSADLFFDDILRYKISRLICFCTDRELQKQVAEFTRKNGFSLCFLRDGCDDWPVVYTDDFNASRQAVELLVRRGHRRIGMLRPADEVAFSVNRRDGYLAALREAGIQPDKRLISSRHQPEDHEKDVRAMFALPPEERPTALFCANDYRALLLENMLLRLGLRLPEECAIVGFGNTLSPSLYCPVTTVSQPFREIGRLAFLTVLGKPEKQYETSPGVYLLPAQIIERESTPEYSGSTTIRK